MMIKLEYKFYYTNAIYKGKVKTSHLITTAIQIQSYNMKLFHFCLIVFLNPSLMTDPYNSLLHI